MKRPDQHSPSPLPTVRLRTLAPGAFSLVVDRIAYLEHRHLDAECRCGMADDRSFRLATDGRSSAGGDAPSLLRPRRARWGARRHRGPPPTSARRPKLDAAGGCGP